MKRILSRVIDFALYAAIAVMLYTFISRKMSGPSEGSEAAAIDLPLVGDHNPSSGTPSSGTPSSGTPSSGTPSSGTPQRRPQRRSHFKLADHRGKPVLIEVFASWCGACRTSAPTVVEAFRKHGQRGVEFVGVSVDSSEQDAARAKREWGIPYDVAMDDGRLSKDYKIEVLPTFVLVGRDGKVRRVSTGAPSAAELERWLTGI